MSYTYIEVNSENLKSILPRVKKMEGDTKKLSNRLLVTTEGKTVLLIKNKYPIKSGKEEITNISSETAFLGYDQNDPNIMTTFTLEQVESLKNKKHSPLFFHNEPLAEALIEIEKKNSY